MNKRLIIGVIPIIIIVCCCSVVLFESVITPPVASPQELDFTVAGGNACLRFLNDSVSLVYVPIATGANEQWQLTVNATKMAGGGNYWTDVYLYKGYWDGGVNHTCIARDIYPILADIECTDALVTGKAPYTQTFGGSSAESCTVFFVFPPGEQSVFHITLKQVYAG
ncbi:MAG: hypothetical protein ACQCN6_08770 [Candidatus Bathyarchaeia archaeon]